MKKFFYVCVAMAIASCSGNHQATNSNENSESSAESAVLQESIIEDTMAPSSDGVDVVVGETPAESESMETGWTVPFEFQVRNGIYTQDGDVYSTLTTYQLSPNGRLKIIDDEQYDEYGARVYAFNRSKWNPNWQPDPYHTNHKEFTGKWSTTYITRGEGLQKVYVIDRPDWENSIYLPDDLEYIWHQGAVTSYSDCENYDIDKAYPVINAKKL